ncbi:thermonuclease family protein [Candidatus Accumulibacter sp. ACC012]|jgi:endonuclease YncB( thermonuclease family)|uniref:thermonuclease family protein n=1 Tax=Candidatus Accumulibacter sp. ACC012 TaxID=2823332 RepID=UPI0025C1685A|nr:thermonuclease family protein [Candidatus Accumulibacter sp. ACC012]
MQAGHLVFAFLLLASIATRAETLVGTVVGVADGDTVTVLDADHQQHKIRIGGVDSPEKAQPYGQRSKQNMSALVFGKEVDVHWQKRDRYRRIVGKVMVQPSDCPTCPKTLDAGLAQVTMGLAWWYEKYAKDQSAEDAGRYEFAEHEARAKRAGLWADASPIPPWDWRKAQRR